MTDRTKARLALATSAGLLLALAAAPVAAQPAPPSAITKGAQFEQKLERSRFSPGPNMRRETEGMIERVIGDKGVFVTDRVTGATLAVPNAVLSIAKPRLPAGAAPDAQGPVQIDFPRPLSENAEEHTAAVRQYLLSAGIPEAEVSGTHVTTTMAGGGPVRDGVQSARSTLLWYTTHLERSLGGIPIEGSLAYVALDSGGQAITEAVYWPEIPSEIVERAQAFRRRLASSQTRAEFMARVRKVQPGLDDTEGKVLIKHTSSFYHGPFQVQVVYAVLARSPFGGKVRILRFDEAGALLSMADDVAPGRDSPKRR